MTTARRVSITRALAGPVKRFVRSVTPWAVVSMLEYNCDKPHRCPECHAVNITDGEQKRILTLASVTCCRCGVEFTRWPKLPIMKRRGVVCVEHLGGAQ